MPSFKFKCERSALPEHQSDAVKCLHCKTEGTYDCGSADAAIAMAKMWCLIPGVWYVTISRKGKLPATEMHIVPNKN